MRSVNINKGKDKFDWSQPNRVKMWMWVMSYGSDHFRAHFELGCLMMRCGSDAIIASFSHFLLNRSQIAQSPSFAARIENEIYAETLLLNMKKSWIHLTTRWRNPATLASSRHFNLWLLSCWWRFQLPFISYKIVILVNWSLKKWEFFGV